jgi:MFS family permease
LFLSPLIAAGIATAWGWRGSFVTLAVPTAVVGIVLYVLLGRRLPTRIAQATTVRADAEETPAQRGSGSLACFVFLSTFTHAVVYSIISFIPLFLVDHFGIEKKTAAALVSFIYSAGLWAGPLGGHFSDRLGRVPVVLAMCLMSGPLIYLLNLAPYKWGIYTLFLIIGMTIYVRMPVSEAYIVGRTSERRRSSVLGIYFFGNMEGGGVLTPGMGYLIDHFGFYIGFTVAGGVVLAVALVCAAFLQGSRQ